MNQLLRLATIRSADDAVSPDSRLEAAETLRPSDDTCQSPVGPRILEIDTLVSARGLVKSYRKCWVEVPVLARRELLGAATGRIPRHHRSKRLRQEHAPPPAGNARRARRGENFEGNRIDNLPAAARDCCATSTSG